MQLYLRCYFGFKYRGVSRELGRLYSEADLRRDLAWNPAIRYIGGHDIRPHVDFGEFERNLRWFSIFREPGERLLSHYYQQVSKPGADQLELLEWMDKNPNRSYWQTYMISGTDNATNAIEIIDRKYEFVGLNEHYEESLALFTRTFSLTNFTFQLRQGSPGPEESTRFEKIKDYAELHSKEISERLHQDNILYGFVRNRYEDQKESVSKDTLAFTIEDAVKDADSIGKYNIHNLSALTLDHLFWRSLDNFRKPSREK